MSCSSESLEQGDSVSDDEWENSGGEEITDVGVVANVDGESGETEVLLRSFSFL